MWWPLLRPIFYKSFFPFKLFIYLFFFISVIFLFFACIFMENIQWGFSFCQEALYRQSSVFRFTNTKTNFPLHTYTIATRFLVLFGHWICFEAIMTPLLRWPYIYVYARKELRGTKKSSIFISLACTHLTVARLL